MIASFADKDTKSLFSGDIPHRFSAFAKIALRKLDMLEAAVNLNDLRVPPGNRLEKLSDDREEQWSIRINGQWRICFFWNNNRAESVEIADYH